MIADIALIVNNKYVVGGRLNDEKIHFSDDSDSTITS